MSRDALNIDGLSEATLQKFIAAGLLKDLPDIFTLKDHKDEVTSLEGMGEKSYNKLTENIESARTTTMARFIYGLGIDGIGAANGKLLAAAFGNDISRLRAASKEELTAVDKIGDVLADGIIAYFADPAKSATVDRLLSYVTFEAPQAAASGADLTGKVFVITGSLNHYSNRKQLQEEIEALGGKVTGSVSAATSYLINNDITSTSSKNRRAAELGIPIISEEEVIEMMK